MKTKAGNIFLFLASVWMGLVSCSVFPALARGEQITLDDSLTVLSFGRQVEFLEDKGKNKTIIDVVVADAQWRASQKDAINLGFTDSAYWFRFTVDNVLERKKQWYFELTYPHLDYLEFYTPAPEGGFEKIKTGDHYPFSHRPVADKDFVFFLEQNPGTVTYYVRVETTSSLNFEPVMRSKAAYLTKLSRIYPILWAYYGALLIMIIYNVVLYFLIRDRTFLFLVLFITSYLLLQFSLNGFAFQYLWPDSVWWANNCLPMFMCLTAALFVLFTRQFLKTADLFPGKLPDKLEKYGIIVPNFIWALCALSGNYALSVQVATGLLGMTVFIFSVTIFLRRETSRPLRIIVISCSIMGFGLLLFISKTIGLLPSSFFTIWSVQIGSAIFVALLSLGLADKLSVLKNDLVSINSNTSIMLQSISQKNGQQPTTAQNIREEEIGKALQTRFQRFMDRFKDLVDDVRTNANHLSSAASALFGLSDKMSAEAGDMSAKADSVASASEEMSERMTGISGTMEQAAQNVNLIASSAEEMATTVNEISSNTEAARSTTAEAVAQSKTVSRRVDELGKAADKIGLVTEAITKISKKTNLLALNATIEAARAGTAGQGFAVVAGEIKALARRTTEATQQISQQIDANRAITEESILEIRQINNIINKIDEIVSTIASSIEEQSVSTREVAGNVSQISQGVSETTKSVSQCSGVTGTVSRDVWNLSGSSQRMNENSQHIKKSAAELSQMADHLTELIQKFRV